MSVGFEKHRSEIVAAWKDVLDDQSTTNWALYSYEGQTNELKVVGSGEGGLEELCDELNSSKIMYAFCRIADPKTGLKKFLIINWQGEGAPVLRKGTCANHIHEVTKLLSGAHLTIAARNEDDIDMERLLKKLSTVSSAYSFKEPRSFTGDQQKAPVGTNYTRVIPTKELNASVMQDFWRKEEEEEKKRLAAEKEAKRLELAKLEQEQRAREEKEHQKREQIVVGGGSKLQPAHVPIKTSPQPLSPEKTVAAFSAGLTEAERMRQMRNQEAKELIGSRVGAAKAIFTKNTSEGQLQTKLNTAPPAKPARTSIAQRINAFNQQDTEQNAAPAKARSPTPGKITLPKEIPTEVVPQQPQQPQQQKIEEAIAEEPEKVVEVEKEAVKPQETIQQPVKPEITAIANADDPFQPGDNNYSAIEPEEQYSTIKRSPHSKSNSLQSPDDNTVVSNSTDTAVYQDNDDDDNSGEAGDEEIICPKISVTTQQSQASKNGMMTSLERNELKDLVNEDDLICQDSWGDLGLRATALYDYQAADESEISFDPGDIITHIDQIDEGWWQGLGPDGTYGLFPANYVEILK